MTTELRRFRTPTFGVALLAFAAACASSGPERAPLPVAVPENAWTAPLDEVVPVGPNVVVGELSNGLTYYIREHDEPENRAELRLVVRVGSTVEDDDQLGLAHFLEHMAFNGTDHFEKGELVQFMESIGMRFGAGINASTSFDETTYVLTIPTDDPSYVETALQILEDWAHGMSLEPEEIDRERGVVIEEWRFRRGVDARVSDQQLEVIFDGSRYAERMPIGTVENLQTFDHEALRRFYRDWYRPDLMAVVAVGDFDGAEVERLVRDHFEDWRGPSNRRERTYYPVPDRAETRTSIVTDPELTATSVWVYHMMDPTDDWTHRGYRRRIVESLYNSMLNDRLAEIARRPNAPFLGASSSQGSFVRTKEVYALGASVREGGVAAGLEAVFAEAERVDRYGFTETELARAKRDVLRSVEEAYTNRANATSGSFAAEYIRAYLDGESIPGIEYEWELYQRFVPEISLEEVNAVGREWIRDENRVILVTAPSASAAGLPSAADLVAVLDGVRRAPLDPWVDSVAGETLMEELPTGSPIVEERTVEDGIVEWRLANGILVVLKATDFEEDRIVFRGFSPGGFSLAPDDLLIPAQTAVEVVAGGGLGDFDAISLGRVLTGTVASASPFISEYSEGVSGGGSVRDLETLFQLIHLRFTRPRMDPEYFEVWLTRMREALANRDANPGTAFNDAYVRLMTQDHPRERPFTLERLSEADLEASFEFYRDRFADAGDFTFVFVGSVDPEAMRPLVERYLGGLPVTGRRESWRDTGVRFPEGVVQDSVRRGLEPISQTVVTFTGPFPYGNQAARAEYRALAMILETRLNNRIREELGGTYSIGVSPGLLWRPEEEYSFTVVFGSDPDRADELLAAVFEILEEFKADGPTESEAADARQGLLRQFETDFRDNSTWLNQLVNDYERGDPPGRGVGTFEDTVRAMTPTAIREMAVRVLDTSRYVRLTLLPE